MSVKKNIQYAMAVLLIVSSIALVTFQVLTRYNVASGLLIYVAQAFLLAGAIFGLDYYTERITRFIRNTHGQKENYQDRS